MTEKDCYDRIVYKRKKYVMIFYYLEYTNLVQLPSGRKYNLRQNLVKVRVFCLFLIPWSSCERRQRETKDRASRRSSIRTKISNQIIILSFGEFKAGARDSYQK